MFVTPPDASAAEHVEVVADSVERRERIRCDEQRPALRAELQDQPLYGKEAFDVESPERFVEQQDLFVPHQQQDQRQAFPLGRRHPRRLGVGRHGQALEQRCGVRRGVAAAYEVDAVPGGEPRPEVRLRLQIGHVAPPQGASACRDAA